MCLCTEKWLEHRKTVVSVGHCRLYRSFIYIIIYWTDASNPFHESCLNSSFCLFITQHFHWDALWDVSLVSTASCWYTVRTSERLVRRTYSLFSKDEETMSRKWVEASIESRVVLTYLCIWHISVVFPSVREETVGTTLSCGGVFISAVAGEDEHGRLVSSWTQDSRKDSAACPYLKTG